jgi:hypothetical protein
MLRRHWKGSPNRLDGHSYRDRSRADAGYFRSSPAAYGRHAPSHGSAEPTCATCRRLLAIRVSQQRRATRTLIPSGCVRSRETFGCTRSFPLPMSQVRQKAKGWGRSPQRRSYKSCSRQARGSRWTDCAIGWFAAAMMIGGGGLAQRTRQNRPVVCKSTAMAVGHQAP